MKKYKNEELFNASKNLSGAEKWARKITFKAESVYRKHKFSCGTDGKVVKEMTFAVQFPKGIDVQSHADFEANITAALAKAIELEIEGYFDAQ